MRKPKPLSDKQKKFKKDFGVTSIRYFEDLFEVLLDRIADLENRIQKLEDNKK